jgi:tryptophan-rich sensory protein
VASITDRSDGDGLVEKLKSRSIPALIVFATITLTAGFIGSRLTATSNQSWYREIDKPSFNPPSWVFGPVWTALYVAMAVAAWLGWRHGSENKPVQKATALFGTQLGLNVLWSGLFFAARAPAAALAEIVVLWSAILAWLVQSAKVEPRTRWLILPYLAWTTFAFVLNASIWWKNR